MRLHIENKYIKLNDADRKVVQLVLTRMIGKPRTGVETFVTQLKAGVAGGSNVRLAGELVSQTAVDFIVAAIEDQMI